MITAGTKKRKIYVLNWYKTETSPAGKELGSGRNEGNFVMVPGGMNVIPAGTM